MENLILPLKRSARWTSFDQCHAFASTGVYLEVLIGGILRCHSARPTVFVANDLPAWNESTTKHLMVLQQGEKSIDYDVTGAIHLVFHTYGYHCTIVNSITKKITRGRR